MNFTIIGKTECGVYFLIACHILIGRFCEIDFNVMVAMAVIDVQFYSNRVYCCCCKNYSCDYHRSYCLVVVVVVLTMVVKMAVLFGRFSCTFCYYPDLF